MQKYIYIAGIVIALVVFLLIAFSIRIDNTDDSPPTPTDPAYNVASVFYIGWGGGAYARQCKGFDCDITYSFEEQLEIELPYSSIDDMSDWVDMSEYCEKECFAHRSVFSTDPASANITPNWEDRVVKIICADNTSGSGLLTLSNKEPAIITAKHVIDGKSECRVFPPKLGFKLVDENSFKTHAELDLGIILLGSFNESVDMIAKKPVSVCESGIKTEEIFVFGYPDTIPSNSASVVEGIISNYDQNAYAISANIGPGYSGGVAVKKDDGCYLGIPSLVRKSPSPDAVGIGNVGVILKATNLKYDVVEGFSF